MARSIPPAAVRGAHVNSFRFSLLLARIGFPRAFPWVRYARVHAHKTHPSLKIRCNITTMVSPARKLSPICERSRLVLTPRANAADSARDNARARRRRRRDQGHKELRLRNQTCLSRSRRFTMSRPTPMAVHQGPYALQRSQFVSVRIRDITRRRPGKH